jgi:hypothetical protein
MFRQQSGINYWYLKYSDKNRFRKSNIYFLQILGDFLWAAIPSLLFGPNSPSNQIPPSRAEHWLVVVAQCSLRPSSVIWPPSFLPWFVRSFARERNCTSIRSELVERNQHKSPNRIFEVIVFKFSSYFLSLIVKLNVYCLFVIKFFLC